MEHIPPLSKRFAMGQSQESLGEQADGLAQPGQGKIPPTRPSDTTHIHSIDPNLLDGVDDRTRDEIVEHRGYNQGPKDMGSRRSNLRT